MLQKPMSLIRRDRYLLVLLYTLPLISRMLQNRDLDMVLRHLFVLAIIDLQTNLILYREGCILYFLLASWRVSFLPFADIIATCTQQHWGRPFLVTHHQMMSTLPCHLNRGRI